MDRLRRRLGYEICTFGGLWDFYGVATGLCSLKQLLSHQFLALKAICPAETVTNTAVQIILILNVLKYTVVLNIRVRQTHKCHKYTSKRISPSMLLHNVKERKRTRFVASYLTSNLKKTLRIMLYAHCRAEIDWVLGQ